MLGFIILPNYTPSFIDLEIIAWQYLRWILTAIFGIGAVIILGQALMDLGQNLTPLLLGLGISAIISSTEITIKRDTLK